MSFYFFRRRRRLDPAELRVPETSGVNIRESDGLTPRAGAPQFFGANGSPLPRPLLVHRYSDPLGEVWRAPQPSMLASTVRRGGVRAPRARLPSHLLPLQAQRPWHLFNVVPASSPAVSFCVRRRVRKEVLFAKHVAGRKRSPGRGGSYNRTAFSSVRC